jgi:alpha-ribazole phosphatase/probable phosphoglycerate mutase
MVLIRHAHTANGTSPLLSGCTDVPLSSRGHGEIRCLQRRLRGIAPFDAIYSSPLTRAWQTAEALQTIGLGELYPCAALREIDCGMLDGMPLREVQRLYPALWAANLDQNDDRFRWPGGESYREFRCRILRGMHGLAVRHRGGRIAVVTHAGVISQTLGVLAGIRPARWECFRPGNGAITELAWFHGRATIVAFDDRSHLVPAAG